MSAQTEVHRSVLAARDHLEGGRIEEGEAILEGILQESPGHAEALCLQGYALFMRSDLLGALRLLERALDADPLQFDARFLYGCVLEGLGESGRAADAYRKVLSMQPDSLPPRFRLAQVLAASGDLEGVEACLEEGRAYGITDDQIEALLLKAGAPGHAEVEWVDPRTILHASRFDVVAKYLYARELLGEPTFHSGYDTEAVYRRHILFRTGGAEPGDESRKATLDDFVGQFRGLIPSLARHGFNPHHPIPVARSTGLILNGAHRLAAALALEMDRVPVVYEDDVEGLTWDHDWFVDQGFDALEVDELTRAWIQLQEDRAACVTLWPTVEAHWDAIEAELQARCPVVCRRDFAFTRAEFAEAVREVYTTDWGPVAGENIERKIERFADYAPKLRLLVVSTPQRGEELKQLKVALREAYRNVVPEDWFATLHTTDTVFETRQVAEFFLNRANLAALSRRPAEIRPEFLAWLEAYFQSLTEQKLNPENCCVVGSSVLEVLGIRDSTDIDFTVTNLVRRERYTPGVTHLTPDLDVVSENYPRAILRGPAPTDDDLVGDRALHFRFRGLKFAGLDVVRDRKQTQRRPKDLADIALVGRAKLEGRL